MADEKVAKFILRSSIDQRKGKLGVKFASMTEDQLKEYVEKCTMFYPKQEIKHKDDIYYDVPGSIEKKNKEALGKVEGLDL